MKLNKILLILLSIICLTSCVKQNEEADFSSINAVCELATLKCYYHNVAKMEQDASGILKFLGKNYKKLWIEYSGVVELGIDVQKVSILKPDKNGVVRVVIPNAEVLNIDLDVESLAKPLTDTGFLTKITKEEETQALDLAQIDMEENAKQNTALLIQAKERAKKIIEGYIINVGEQIGKKYIVEWIEVE